MPSPILPKALSPGDTIAFISPSARLNSSHSPLITRATTLLTGLGYHIRPFFTPDTTLQSSISNRLSELRAAFTDPSISAIITTCGGPSFTELLPALIADTALHAAIRAHPKIVVGYSDITGLHWFLYALTGLRTFYGPGAIPELGEASDPADEKAPLAFCVEHLFRAIARREPLGDLPRSLTYMPLPSPYFDQPEYDKPLPLTENPGWVWLRDGKAEGRLFGGCLTVMARLSGVKGIVPDWRGRIVFFETALGEDEKSGNPIYKVQAGIADLIAQGVFDEAAGVVVGRPFGYDSEEMRGEYMGVVKGLLCEGRMAENGFPILFGVDIGHTTPMVTLPYDALATLNSEQDKFTILESGVI